MPVKAITWLTSGPPSAEGRSCLFARTSKGMSLLSWYLKQSCKAPLGDVGHLMVLQSSTRASSRLSGCDESTTKMIPSVHLQMRMSMKLRSVMVKVIIVMICAPGVPLSMYIVQRMVDIRTTHLVYDRHRGRIFSCPPTSQTRNVNPRLRPIVPFTRSQLKPIVGTVFTYWSNFMR